MSGNGVDIAAVYGLLREVANTTVRLPEQAARLEHGMVEVKHDLARKADKDDVAGLRQAVTGYPASVMGHGILIPKPGERPRRVERRPAMGAPS